MEKGLANEEFCKNYETHEIYKKKLKALQNFARTIEKFDHWIPVELALRYSRTHFLSAEMCLLIDSVLKKHNIEYLDWCCQTKWVVAKMDNRSREAQGMLPFHDFYAARDMAWSKLPFPTLFEDRKFMTARSA